MTSLVITHLPLTCSVIFCRNCFRWVPTWHSYTPASCNCTLLMLRFHCFFHGTWTASYLLSCAKRVTPVVIGVMYGSFRQDTLQNRINVLIPLLIVYVKVVFKGQKYLFYWNTFYTIIILLEILSAILFLWNLHYRVLVPFRLSLCLCDKYVNRWQWYWTVPLYHSLKLQLWQYAFYVNN